MPTPLEMLLDPVSLIILALIGILLLLEHIVPGRKQPKANGWYPRAFVCLLHTSIYRVICLYCGINI